jgi:hypothetical protein
VSLWRHRDFLLLWSAQTVSDTGTRVGRIAVPLLAVTALSATPWQTGLLVAAETAAFLLVGLPAGALVDRARRRPVMVTADLFRVALLLAVPVAWWLGVLTFPLLVAVVLAVGVATVVFDVGYQSVLPSVVGRAGLIEGNAKLESTRSAAVAVGPALGGVAVQLIGAATPDRERAQPPRLGVAARPDAPRTGPCTDRRLGARRHRRGRALRARPPAARSDEREFPVPVLGRGTRRWTARRSARGGGGDAADDGDRGGGVRGGAAVVGLVAGAAGSGLRAHDVALGAVDRADLPGVSGARSADRRPPLGGEFAVGHQHRGAVQDRRVRLDGDP